MKQYTQTEFKKDGATYKNISSPNGQITDLKQVNNILVSSTDNGATFAPIKVAVVNNLTSNDGTVPLAAAQGKVLNTSVTNNTNLVVAETTARIDADNALQSNIDTETTNRTTADNAIKADLATEVTNRQNADTTLQSNITAEETARTTADTALQNALNTESANAVKVIAQTFTTAQQAQARTNIGAGTSSFNGAYSALTGKPILNTTNTAAQATNATETINGTINLHKISKTGTFSDLRNIPTATTGVAGIVNLATDQESATGTNATKAITPKQLKTAIEGLGTVFDFKGSVANVADLPQTGNTVGDVWYVIAQSVGYIWLNDGTTNRWEQFGATIDLSGYMQYTDIVNNLTSTATNKVLSAYQGKVLNDSKATVTALTAETTARTTADTTLQTNINNEETARTTADKAIKADLATEVTNRQNADTTLQNNKVDKNNAITAGTKTKITYDSKGLVTSGADLTGADIPTLPASKITQSTTARFVTDTEKSTWNGKQNALTAGDGISISGNIISADCGLTVETWNTATKTLVLSDSNKLFKCSHTANQTLTIPTNATVAFPIGTMITFLLSSTNVVTFSGASGVTLTSIDSLVELKTQYAMASLIKTDTNTWQLVGALE